MRLDTLLPRGARFRLRSLRHQLEQTGESLRSSARPVFVRPNTPEELAAIAARTRASAPLRARTRELRVAHVLHPSADSIQVVFENPASDPIRFAPGQFLTLEVGIDGATHRRQYSFCSSPYDERTVSIAIRRVAGGLVSNHLADRLAAGDVLRTVGPSGRFGTTPDPSRDRRIVLVAGGAGITPLWSIAQALIAGEPGSTVTLVYANRGASRVMFAEPIAAMAADPRFSVTHVLERASRTLPAVRGRLTPEVMGRVLPVSEDTEYYVCGPEPMMDAVVGYLQERGVDPDQVRVESFTVGRREAAAPDTRWSVRFARSGRAVEVDGNRTLLEAARAAGLELPFSCAMGGCAACKVRVRSGEVHMPKPNCLSAEEAARGEVLACVAQPRSAIVVDA